MNSHSVWHGPSSRLRFRPMRTRYFLPLPMFAAFMLLSVIPASAQDDVEGGKDHPVLARLAGYYLAEADEQEFAPHEFTIVDDMKKVEGRYWRLSYWLKEGA